MLSAELYHAVQTELPDVNLYMMEASSAVIYEWLREERLDFGLVMNLSDDAGLSTCPLYMEDLCLVSLPDPGGDTATTIDFDQLSDLPIITACGATAGGKLHDQLATSRGQVLNPLFAK